MYNRDRLTRTAGSFYALSRELDERKFACLFKMHVTVVRLRKYRCAVSSMVRHSDTKIIKVWNIELSLVRCRAEENRSFLKL